MNEDLIFLHDAPDSGPLGDEYTDMSRYFCLRETVAVDDFLEGFSPLPAESVPLAQALGRVTARGMFAPEPYPRSSRSTRDGFALRSADTMGCSQEEPACLRLAGQCGVGQDTDAILGTGEAWRVVTGSGLPRGADVVVMQEDVFLEDEFLCVTAPQTSGTNVLPAGADLPQGALLINAGQRLHAHDMALLSQFYSEIQVRRCPRLGIVVTGDEFCRYTALDPGLPSAPVSSNAQLLTALADTLGAKVLHLGVVPDDAGMLRQALIKGLPDGLSPCDVLVVVGGSSAGKKDFSAQAIASLPGCSLAGQDQRVSKGRPLTIARVGGTSIWGLPGHTLSLALAAQIFLAPLLLRLMGQNGVKAKGNSAFHLPPHGVEKSETVRALLAETLPPQSAALAHFPVTLRQEAHCLMAFPVPLGTGKTSILRNMSGWVTPPDASRGLRRGSSVAVHLFR